MQEKHPHGSRSASAGGGHSARQRQAVEQLAREGFDPASGARPLRRLVRRQVEDPIAEGMLAGRMTAGKRLRLKVEENTLVIAVEKE